MSKTIQSLQILLIMTFFAFAGCSGCAQGGEDSTGDGSSTESDGNAFGDNGGDLPSGMGVDAGDTDQGPLDSDGGTDDQGDGALPIGNTEDGGSTDDPPEGMCGDATCDSWETCASCAEDCGECVTPPAGEECGNGVCDGEEGCYICPQDCDECGTASAMSCGDGLCGGDEGCHLCPSDCGECPVDAGVATGYCGDESCQGSETCVTCAADCAPCDAPSEDAGTHAADSGTPPAPGQDGGASPMDPTDGGAQSSADAGEEPVLPPEDVCGDGICGPTENTANCWIDCGTHCGDQVCNGQESCSTCAADCGLCEEPEPGEGFCGDGWCTLGETTANCWQDCGTLCGDSACNHIETCESCELDCGVCPSDPMDPSDGPDAGPPVQEEDCKGADVIGNPCNDGLLNTRDDVCVADGICQGVPFECVLKECQLSSTPNGENCDVVWAEDGYACQDGQFCTVNDTCQSGLCTGEPRDCSDEATICQDASCNDQVNACVVVNKPDQTECEDGLFCTVGDHCFAGQCIGESRDCTEEDDQCNLGKCNEDEEICEKRALPDGTSCNDGNYCSVENTCELGECGGGEQRDCSWVTDIDPCYFGLCSSIQSECLFISNNTCVDCATDRPIANAGSNQSTAPDEMVYLDGTQSSSPINSPLSYSWQMVSMPSGSNTSLMNAGTATPSFLGDVAGEYVACLVVTDGEECESDPSCVTIDVRPQVAIHVELTWETDDSDLDLHYLSANGSYFNSPTDCYYGNKTPDWGLNGEGQADGISGNDPRLDVDNTSGYGPENVNQDEPFDTTDGYRVTVHFYCDHGGGNTPARVRIYINGSLAYETTQVLGAADFWEVADITVWGDGAYIDITPVNTPITTRTSPSCH